MVAYGLGLLFALKTHKEFFESRNHGEGKGANWSVSLAVGTLLVVTVLVAPAVLWIVRTRSPRRDLPPFFGNWNTVFKRYRDWVKADVFTRLFEACSRHARHEVRHSRRHHRQSPSPRTGDKKGSQSQAIGRSKGGMTTKILALTDASGNLVRFVLLPGHRFDTVGVTSAYRRSRL
jgi:transposase